MKNLQTILAISLIITVLALLYSCSQDTDILSSDINSSTNLESRDDRDRGDDRPGEEDDQPQEGDDRDAPSFTKNWEEGTYLVFADEREFAETYRELNHLIESDENSSIITEGYSDCFENPALDQWEAERGGEFESMRSTYERYECDMLNCGADPSGIKGIPLIDDALATLVSIDGLIQIGEEIIHLSDDANAKAPVQEKETLKNVLDGSLIPPPNFLKNKDIKIQLRSSGNCSADFNFQINHNTLDVYVEYTGSSITGGDKSITWSAIPGDDHKNETSFTLDYNSPGTKTICVTYNEYDVVPDTTYYYVKEIVDGDTICVQKFNVSMIKKLVCSDTECKDIELGGCTAEFSHTVGIDNVVSFANLSSVAHGDITSVLWQFGDGNTSTQMHPTHTYECDKDFEVTLIIYSNQCPGGSATFTQTVDATGIRCCDENPQSSWKTKYHPTDDKKKIKYRYDMGTNAGIFNGILDQDLKGKIEYYEYRSGGIWPFNGTKWRKTDGLLDVNFNGPVFGNDEDGCTCQQPRNTEAEPPTDWGKSKTFKDEFGGWWTPGADKKLRMKDTDPVIIDYNVNGVLYVTQVCTSEPGFHCE